MSSQAVVDDEFFTHIFVAGMLHRTNQISDMIAFLTKSYVMYSFRRLSSRERV